MTGLRSMTGFGVATSAQEGLTAQVEVRVVNHRGLKVSVRSRPSLGVCEKALRDQIGARIQRGAVDVYISVTRPIDAAHPPVREAYARDLIAALQRLGECLQLDTRLALRDLLLVPGLLAESGVEPLTETEWPAVAEAAASALAQADQMRLAEGEATVARLRELVGPVVDFAREARRLAPAVVTRQRERLVARLRELCPDGRAPGDEQALERELCFYADRADINEEMDRLESHVAQFQQALDQGGEVGKRLEFLAQEFLRELNTAASKANDTDIVRLAVDAKIAVEKIKEQAANLE